MEQPDFEKRLSELETVTNDIIKNEQLLVRLAKRHRLGLEELVLDVGDVRERIDELDRKLDHHHAETNRKLDQILERLSKSPEA